MSEQPTSNSSSSNHSSNETSPEQPHRGEDQVNSRLTRQSSRLDAMPLAKRMSNWLSGSEGFCDDIYHGWLMKKGKKRWFVLSGGDLYWFNSREYDIFSKKPNNWLPIEADTTCARIDEKSFTIISEGRQYNMSTIQDQQEPEEEIIKWLKAIKEVIAGLRARQGGTTVKYRQKGYLIWKKTKYYFVLRDRYISYFKSESSRKPLGKIPMYGIELERKSVSSVSIIRKARDSISSSSSSNSHSSSESTSTASNAAITPNPSTIPSGLSQNDVCMDLIMASPREADEWFNALENVRMALIRTSPEPPSETIAKLIESVGVPLDAVVDGELIRSIGTTLESVNDIKTKLMPKVCQRTPELGNDRNLCLLKAHDLDVWLIPEHVPLHQLPLFGLCGSAKVIPKVEIVRKSDLVSKGIDLKTIADTAETNSLVSKGYIVEEKRSRMIGGPYARLLSMAMSENASSSEFLIGRANLLRYVNDIMPAVLQSSKQDLFPQYKEAEPIPKKLPEHIIISCVLPKNFSTKLASFSPDTTPNEVKKLFFDKWINLIHDPQATKQFKMEDFKLKVVGVRSYLEDGSLLSFDYIRKCLNHSLRIQLSLVLPELTSAADIAEDTFLFNLTKLHDTREIPIENPVPSSSQDQSFRIRIVEIETLQPDLTDQLIDFSLNNIDVSFSVSVNLMHGGTLLAPPMATRAVNYRYHLKAPDDTPKISFLINQWLVVNFKIKDLPRESRLLIKLTALQNSGINSGKEICIGWTNYCLYGHQGILRLNSRAFHLWPGEAKPYSTTSENLLSVASTILQVEFQKQDQPILFTQPQIAEQPQTQQNEEQQQENEQIPAEISSAMKFDKLISLSIERKQQIFALREDLVKYPQYLVGFLLSVDWTNPKQTQEAYSLLKRWSIPQPSVGLELLDWKFGDEVVREYAVSSCLDRFSDGEVADCLLQLVNVVKYELHHDSALSKFLIRRALMNKTIVGHSLYWLLKSEFHTSVERLGTLLEAFLRGCGALTLQELSTEEEIICGIAHVASIVKDCKKEERDETTQYELRKLSFPPHFKLPLFSDRENSSLILSACRYMKSKKLPLWLVFRNSDTIGEDSFIIYKRGDDLRQDVLTLQMIKIFDKLWISDGLDLKLLPYGVISTGTEEGMVEIVRSAETIGSIHRHHGGTAAVLKQEILAAWLKEKNPVTENYLDAVKNFALSCAGYCVATFVLGIGDRHNDNLMIRTDGRLFHIDFGHILGHYKTKFGMKRERAPFIFTPQMCFLLGGKGSPMYQLFLDSCIKAYQILRRNVDKIITLFSLMLCAELPELQSVHDISWISDHLRLDLSVEDSSKFFLQLVEESLHTVSTQLMDMVHLIAN